MEFVPAGDRGWKEAKGYRKRVFFDGKTLSQEGALVQKVCFKPGERVRLHHHEKQTEVFLVISGTGLFHIERKDLHPAPGDLILCEPGDRHYVANNGKTDFIMAVFKTNVPDGPEDLMWDE